MAKEGEGLPLSGDRVSKLTIAHRRQLREASLYINKYATRSTETKGRLMPEELDATRTPFERDGHRIMHSLPFRRLRHKTQVFFFPRNDHICTRLEHSLHVSSISQTIARCLNLNVELVDAIAKGHDLGHAPFGHHGEDVLDELCRKSGLCKKFQHEPHSLRVVQRLATIPGRDSAGLNLTFEVCDGIVSHYGEKQERRLEPDRSKSFSGLSETKRGKTLPPTLEACVVRFADRMAYLGRDFEDAIMANLVQREDLPPAIASVLGRNNGEMIRTMVSDIVEIYQAKEEEVDAVEVSDKVHKAMGALLQFNNERIYKHPRVDRYKKHVKGMLESIWHALLQHAKPDCPDADEQVYRDLDAFRIQMGYKSETKPQQIVLDFIAGMTDNYALRAYDQLFKPQAIV